MARLFKTITEFSLQIRILLRRLNSIITIFKTYHFDYAIKCDVEDLKMPPWDQCSIVGNLIDNAFEAVIKNDIKREVGLEIKLEDNEYVIYVYNNGESIPIENQEMIFNEGYTTKASKTRGYGLYLVKLLVDQYNGKVEVRSSKKTVFIVRLAIIEEGDSSG